MNIVIDALEANLNNKVGMGNYADNLIRALALIDQKNDYTLYVKNPANKDSLVKQNNFKYKQLASPLIRSFWSQCRIPLELIRVKPDLLHVPTGHKVPFNCPQHTVVTIHDLAFLKFPDYFKTSVKWRCEQFTRHAVLKAEKIIAISESTKKDIIDYYKVDPKKVEVIYHGVEDDFKPGVSQEKIDLVCEKHGITLPFILFVGVLQPRKNISCLIRAFKQVVEAGKDMQLVIAGGKGWMYDEILNTARLSGIRERIIFTGYTPKSDVICLLNAAKVFVLPSLYEGFGLPILEAMACGVPVIASHVSSMPEIVQDAGILIDPDNQQKITQALLDILNNQNLAQILIAKGLKIAQSFTWEKTARKTLKLYESMLKNGK
ncbi:MAG: glycosyltransferase family 4 protein [Candidatus Omnitrophica bacterium]|nr:glycosyltransferase family 4 protein [Candidatus Omnitrophota bacterium]